MKPLSPLFGPLPPNSTFTAIQFTKSPTRHFNPWKFVRSEIKRPTCKNLSPPARNFKEFWELKVDPGTNAAATRAAQSKPVLKLRWRWWVVNCFNGLHRESGNSADGARSPFPRHQLCRILLRSVDPQIQSDGPNWILWTELFVARRTSVQR